MQEINLYQPVSKGVRGMLSARSTSMVFGIVGVTLAGLWGFAWWQLDKLQGAAQVVRNQQQAQAAMIAAQGPQLDGLTDEELTALIPCARARRRRWPCTAASRPGSRR